MKSKPTPKPTAAKLPHKGGKTIPAPAWCLISTGKRESIDPKLIDPHPHNRSISPDSVIGLAQSMAAHGQIQPATVRPHPTKPGRYQLGAGCRRWHAAKINKQPLDCIVRDLSDAEIEAMLAVENLQREAPEPREEAAQIRRLFKLEGSTPQSVAAVLGRPEAWVKRRMRLLDLLDAVHEAWQDPESKLHNLPIASMELIASLSNELQMTFLEEYGESYDAATHDDVVGFIRSQSCSLKDATWLDNPATFIPGCGPGCASSSAATDLFSNTEFADAKESKCAQCLNATCFRKREALARQHQWHTVLAKTPAGYYAITDRYGEDGRTITLPDESTLKLRSKYDFHGWKACKKTDPKARPFIEESGQTVKLTWKAPPEDAETIPKSSAESAVKTPEESQQVSIDRVQGKRYEKLRLELREHVDKAECPAFSPDPHIRADHLIALAAVFGTSHALRGVTDSTYREHSRLVDRLTTDSAWDCYHKRVGNMEATLWHSIRTILYTRLGDSAFTQRKSDLIKPEFITEMIHVSQLTGFDFPAAYARAAAACPPPASLKHLDPLTLKPKNP